MRLLDGDKNELDRDVAEGEFILEVVNEESSIDSGGSGEASADGDNEEP